MDSVEDGGGKPRVLIIDDRPANLLAFQKVLAVEPVTIETCSSARQALLNLRKRSYACILCDVEMPDINGLEFAQIVAADPLLKQTPILFVTASDAATLLHGKAFGLGAYDFLTKPIHPDVLRSKTRIFARLFEQQQELRKQKERFEAIVSNLHEGVALLHGDGRLEYANASWHELTRCRSMLPEHVAAAFQGELVSRREVRFEDSLRRRATRWGELTAQPLQAEPGKVVALVRDTTHERLETERLKNRNEELESFAHAASHDLKTPLRHISNFSEIIAASLREGKIDEEVFEALEIIRGGTQKMRALIDSLLEFAESGTTPEGDFRMVAVEQILKDIWLTLDTGTATLEIEGTPPQLWASSTRLYQLFQNLLENALKFQRPDVPLRLRVRSVQREHGVTVDVEDNGIGVKPAYRERVFVIFQRLHSKQEKAGSGVGLSICRRIMESMGGSIELLSDGVVGTTFRLHFNQESWPSMKASA